MTRYVFLLLLISESWCVRIEPNVAVRFRRPEAHPHSSNGYAQRSVSKRATDTPDNKPAVVLSIGSDVWAQIYSDVPKSIRVKDRVLFVRRAGNHVILTGSGIVKEVRGSNSIAILSDPKLDLQPADEVYISSRDNSVHSLTKARFPRN